MRRAAILAILALGVASAQSFEVASIKRLPIDAPRQGIKAETVPGSLRLHGTTLGYCIRWAYGVQPYQIAGPSWMDPPTDVHFDIDAKAASPAQEAQLKLMLQALLADRLKLAMHREKRDMQVYAMVVGKNGPKFQKSKTEGEGQIKTMPDGSIVAEGISMARLAAMFGPPFTSLPVVDETGFEGGYDFSMDPMRYRDSDSPDMEPAIVRALSEQLGLRLERKRAPVEVLVIDHVEKDPTEN